MAFDEAYNEPENVEVLVKSLDPGQPAQLHYAHAGDAGADLRTTEEVTLKPFQRALCPREWQSHCLPAMWRWCIRVRDSPSSRASRCLRAGNHRRWVPWRNQGAVDQPRSGTRRDVPSGRPHRTAGHPTLRRGKIHRGADPARIRPRGTWLRINRRCVLTGLQYTKTEDVSGPCNTRPDTSVIW